MARHLLDLSLLPVEALADLREATDGLLCRVTKVNARRLAMAIERKMGASISQAWKAGAASGLQTGIGRLAAGPFTGAAISAFLRGLGIQLSTPLTPQQQQVVEGNLRSIYRVSKQDAVTAARGRFMFGEPDQLAIAASGNQQMFWVDSFYSEQLSTRVSAVSRDVLLEQGLSHREAGPVLHKALRQEFGLVPGQAASPFAPSVPARYAGNPDFYFQQVSSVAGHQSRIFGKMTGYNDAGVRRVQLVNPNDERTGTLCQQMNGQVFTVNAGMARMSKIVGAASPDEVREEAPWPTADTVADELAGTQPGSRAATTALEGMNTILPPFHPLCRTEVVILD